MNSDAPVVVLKVGGSLFLNPRFRLRINQLLNLRPNHRCLILPGGGAAADVVREWDRIHRPGDSVAHQLALDSLSLNAAFLAALIADAELVADRTAARAAWRRSCPVVLDPAVFVKNEPHARPLPECWDVSSDSVAAWIATHWPAEELILVKSTDVPAMTSVEDAARDGYLDPYLPKLSVPGDRIGWVNLACDLNAKDIPVTALHVRSKRCSESNPNPAS